MFPLFSVLDPSVTFSLPQKQVRNGIVDAFIHVIEQFMTVRTNSPLQDRPFTRTLWEENEWEAISVAAIDEKATA